MANKNTFSVESRTQVGKSVKNLRKNRVVPGNVIVPNEASSAIALSEPAFKKLYNQVGDTGLVYLTIAGENSERPVMVEDVSVNPVKGDVLHVVFKQVNLKEKSTAAIPVHVVGESSVPGAVVIVIQDSIEVEALPTDFPEMFEVNAELLTEAGQTVTFADLAYDKSKVTLLIDEEEMSNPVVMLQEMKEEAPEEPAEGEVAPEETPAPEAAAESAEAA